MATITDTNYTPTLEILESLRDGQIQASIAELRERDRLTMALRAAERAGIPIDDLSAASGLTCAEIRRRISGELALGEDVAAISGAC